MKYENNVIDLDAKEDSPKIIVLRNYSNFRVKVELINQNGAKEYTLIQTKNNKLLTN